MGYDLHIELANEDPIDLEEWNEAVTKTEGVRLAESDFVGVNPTEGSEIRIEKRNGDAEVLFRSGGFLGIGVKKEWIYVFRYFEGSISFSAPRDIKNKNDPVMVAASKLASLLGAQIVGDEGEVYKLKT